MCESLRDMNSVNVFLSDMSQLIAIVVHILKTVSVVLRACSCADCLYLIVLSSSCL